MSKQSPTTQRRRTRFGWGLVFRLAFGRYAHYALLLLLTGLLGTGMEVAAFGIVVIAIRSIETEQALDIFGFQLPAPFTMDHIVMGVGAFFALLALSVFIRFGQGLLTARARRKTFKDAIQLTLARMIKAPQSAYLRSIGQKSLSRLLRRECRYVSKATTEAMAIPRPLIILAAVVALGVAYQPRLLAVVAGVFLLSLPFHLLVGRWGVRWMDRLLDRANAKSQADRRVVRNALSPPLQTDDDITGDLPASHANSPEVSHFLEAYSNRVVLTPLSTLVSRLTFLVVFVAIAVLVYLDYQQGQTNFAALAASLIALRFASTAAAELTQIVTVIGSYAPLTSDILVFLVGRDRKAGNVEEKAIEKSGDQPVPKRFALISDEAISWNLMERLRVFLPEPDQPHQMLSGDYDLLPRSVNVEKVQKVLAGPWAELSETMKTNMRRVLDRKPEDDVSAKALVLLAYRAVDEEKLTVYWESKSFLEMPRNDRELIYDMLQEQQVVLVYQNPPKRMPDFALEGVFTLINNTLEFASEIDQYLHERQNLISRFAANRQEMAPELFEADPVSDL